MKTLSYILVIALIAIGCSQKSNKGKLPIISKVNSTESSIKPIKGLEIKPLIVEVPANKASTIELENGGSIEFPKNAFIDEKGQVISGDVEVKWKEYHSLTDIMFSGIPMVYDSAGSDFNLVSGGMFTISASQSGEEVNLAPGKKAKVNLSSINSQEQFNFYELNEETGAWNYELTAKAEIKDDLEKGVKPVKGDDDFSMIDIELDMREFPELDSKDVLCWKTKHKLKTKDENHLKLNSAKIKLNKKKGEFVLEYPERLKLKPLEVLPYTMEDALSIQRAESKAFDNQVSNLMQFQKNDREGKVIRNISIDNFGTYNWDCVHRWANPKTIFADFNYPIGVDAKTVSVFFVSPTENLILPCNSQSQRKLTFDPERKGSLIAILPGNKLSIINNTEFVRAQIDSKGAKIRFEFRDSGVTLQSPSDINEYVSSLI